MSDFVLHKGKRSTGSFVRDYVAGVVGIEYAVEKPSRVRLANGMGGAGACLGCGDTPCMTKNVSELAIAAPLDAFPGDPSLSVCPTKALDGDEQTAFVSVDTDSWIGGWLFVD